MNEAAQLASGALNEALASIDTNGSPAAVKELASGFRADVNAAIAAGQQREADIAELRQKAPFIPAAGQAILDTQSREEATSRSREALNNARQKAEVLRRAAMLGALPKQDPAREALGRDELALILGEGSPERLALRVQEIAMSPNTSRDALAALTSDFAVSILEARGLTGKALDETLSAAKVAIASSALDRPNRHTEREIASARLFASVGELSAALGATSFYLGSLDLGSI